MSGTLGWIAAHFASAFVSPARIVAASQMGGNDATEFATSAL